MGTQTFRSLANRLHKNPIWINEISNYSQLFENQVNMNKSLKNQTLDVLVENLTEDKTKVFGRSEYMTPVIFKGDKGDIGKIITIKISESNRSTLFGEKIVKSNQRVA